MKRKEMLMPEMIEGEEVIWTGRPTDVPFVEKSGRKKVIIMYVIAIAWLIVALAVYLPFAIDTFKETQGAIIRTVIVSLVPIVLLIVPVLEYTKIRGKIYYVITNYRAISATSTHFNYIFLKKDLPVAERAQNLESKTVVFGKAAGLASSKDRHIVTTESSEKETMCESVVFYRLEDTASVLDEIAKAQKNFPDDFKYEVKMTASDYSTDVA